MSIFINESYINYYSKINTLVRNSVPNNCAWVTIKISCDKNDSYNITFKAKDKNKKIIEFEPNDKLLNNIRSNVSSIRKRLDDHNKWKTTTMEIDILNNDYNNKFSY